ncbi:MAG: RNA-binding domain-containing protein [Candidatus Woesearchaeota archaeon]
MRLAHNIKISVFCKPEDDYSSIMGAFLSLFPFSLEDEKVQLEEQNVLGFNEREIRVFNAWLGRESLTNSFLKHLKERLGGAQCSRIAEEAESRVDDELCLFIRLDKKSLEAGKYALTDRGDCFHIRIKLSVHPKRREKAVRLAHDIFSTKP